MVQREIDAIQRAAKRHEYETLAQLLIAMSDEARKLFERRVANYSRAKGSGPRGLHGVSRNQGSFWTLPAAMQPATWVNSLVVIGGDLVEGRKRANGKQRPRLQVRRFAPVRSRSEPRREAERAFVRRLRAAYYSATGRMPPNTAQHYRAGPFARMVGDCLRLVRAPANDLDDDRVSLAVQLINDFDYKRKLRDLCEKWNRILDPIRHKHTAILNVVRLLERGDAEVRSYPLGADANALPARPSLIEFQERNTRSICGSI